MVRHAFRGFLPWGACCFVVLITMELLYFVPFSVERSDFVGSPSGVEPP